MTTRRGRLTDRGPRRISSPSGRRAAREQAVTAALEEASLKASLVREKTERLKALRLSRGDE
ncbi:MAG: hypothetical protein WD076_01765 [Parvularculaceae bacterium]